MISLLEPITPDKSNVVVVADISPPEGITSGGLVVVSSVAPILNSKSVGVGAVTPVTSFPSKVTLCRLNLYVPAAGSS